MLVALTLATATATAYPSATAWADQGSGIGSGAATSQSAATTQNLATGQLATQVDQITGLSEVDPEYADIPNSYESADGKVLLAGYKSGEVTYDAASYALTISGLNAECFVIKGNITLSLNNANHVGLTANADEAGNGTLTVKGGGALNSPSDDRLSAYNYVQQSGTINAGEALQVDNDARIQGGKITADDIFAVNYTQEGGSTIANNWLSAEENIVVKGGTVRAQSSDAKSFAQSGGTVTVTENMEISSVTVSGGTLTAKDITCENGTFKMTKGTVKVGETLDTNNIIVAGGALSGPELNGFNSVEVTGGSISSGAGAAGIYGGKIAVKGGTITVTKGESGITSTDSITVSGGTITVKNCEWSGITAEKSFTMTGGNVSVTGCEIVIRVGKENSKARIVSGTVKILGGSLTAKGTVEGYYAIETKNFSYKEGCIKAVFGKMPSGYKFTYKKNTYVTNGDGATLMSYKSSKKRVTFRNVKCGGYTYAVTGVDTNAFNTKNGRKVKEVWFDIEIEYLGNKAFANTKALTLLVIAFPNKVVKLNSNGFVVKVNAKKGNYAKKAFANCGKKKGKGLELAVNYVSPKYDKNGFKKVKKMLYAHGLSKRVNIT